MSEQPAFLPDPETGRLQVLPVPPMPRPTGEWLPGAWVTAPAVWPELESSPRCLSHRLSLLEARERLAMGVVAPVVRPRHRRLWLLWVAMALPVAVAVVWRWL